MVIKKGDILKYCGPHPHESYIVLVITPNSKICHGCQGYHEVCSAEIGKGLVIQTNNKHFELFEVAEFCFGKTQIWKHLK